MQRRRFVRQGALVLALAGPLLAGAGLLTLPSRAAATDPCPPDAQGTLTNLSRVLVPVKAAVVRTFNVAVDPGDTVSALKLAAPAGYAGKQLPSARGYGLRLTAPRAGSFDVTATWTETSSKTGSPVTCSASGATTLNASRGTPLTVKPPPAQRYPGRKQVQYDRPMTWTWTCAATADPTPAVLTIRWEIDPRQLPLFSKGGKPPYRFTSRAKAFTVRAGDPCAMTKVVKVIRHLPQGAKLTVLVAGNVSSGRGAFVVNLAGGFRNPSGSKAPFHLGVTMAQGSRKPVDVKLCAWYQGSFEVAEGKGVSCWW
jgi:hypothetical protein